MKLSRCAALALFLTPLYAHAVPVTLRVVDANNKPIAGISVQYADTADVTDEKPTVALSAQTAADGTLALDLRGVPDAADGVTIPMYVQMLLGSARVRSARSGYGIASLFAGDNTLMLREGAQVRGIVRNASGDPVAGAQVTFLGAEKSEQVYSNAQVEYRLAPILATTDAAGQWQIADLPRGYARFGVSVAGSANDEMKFWIDKAEVTAPDVKLRAAGVVRGRILDFQGRPLAKISVDLGDDTGETAHSDGAGRFELPGVPVGESALSFSSSSPNWLGTGDEVKVTIPTPGATVDIGDVRADEGLLLSGRVVNVASKAPVPSVKLKLRNGKMIIQTDAQGRFETRVPQSYFGLEVLGDYVLRKALFDLSEKSDKLDLGEIPVERAARLRLDLRDEAGNVVPLAMVRLRAVRAGETVFSTESARDKQGAVVGPLPADQYQIEGIGVWDVVEPKTVTVALPAEGQAPTLLKIRLRHLEPIRVGGRVVDGVGAPLSQVEVTVKARAGWPSRSAISDKNGNWTAEIQTAFDEPILGEATLAPFAFVRGGAMTRDGAPENNRWKAADIIMARTDIMLKGRVTDANGAAVAGARVSWQGNPKSEFVATNESGNFAIKDVPAAPLVLVASDGSRYAQTAATPGVPAEVKLPPAPFPLSSAQLEALWDKTSVKNLWNLEDYFDVLGAPRIYRAARRLDAGGDPARIGDGLSAYLRMRMARARTRAERFDAAIEGVELLRPIPMNDVSGDAAAKIAVLAARTDDAELQKWAASWYDSRKPRMPQKLDASYYSDSNLLGAESRMSAVGMALGRDDAEKYRADGLTLMRNYTRSEPRFYLTSWGELLWDADSKRFDEALANWPKTEQMGLIVGALKKVDDAAQAKTLWAHLENLSNDATVLAAEATAKQKDKSSWSPREQSLYEGRINYARAVAAVDAPAALDALEKIGNAPQVCGIAVGIARAAIADGRAELARRALSLGLKGIYANTSGTFALATVARDFDAPLTTQLLDRFRESALSEESARAQENRDKGWRDVAAYAFALRDFDAGTGRLLLEDQWAKRRDAPAATGKDYENDQAINEQENLAWAMAIYDLPRALQWLGEIKDQRDEYNNRLELTRVAILATASATPAQRPALLALRNFS